MTDEEIAELLESHRKYNLPDSIVEREFMLALVDCDDPMFLLKVPEPFLSHIVDFGLKVSDEWYEISNLGQADYSAHAPMLRKLVQGFVETVPVGKFVRWKASENT